MSYRSQTMTSLVTWFEGPVTIEPKPVCSFWRRLSRRKRLQHATWKPGLRRNSSLHFLAYVRGYGTRRGTSQPALNAETLRSYLQSLRANRRMESLPYIADNELDPGLFATVDELAESYLVPESSGNARRA